MKKTPPPGAAPKPAAPKPPAKGKADAKPAPGSGETAAGKKAAEKPAAAAPPRRRERFEPPLWWRKWKPLRWLAGLLVLVWLATLLMPEGGDEPAPSVAQAEVAAPEPVSQPPAETSPVPEPAPTAAPVAPAPAPAKAAAATPAPPPVAAPAKPAPVTVVEEEEDAEPPSQRAERQAYTAVAANPVPILSDYQSYQSVDTVVRALEKAGYKPELESRHARVPRDVPPNNLDVVHVKLYKHLGHEGELELQFFNDRLFQADFEPAKPDDYRKALRKALPALKREPNGRSELREGPLRVASSLDLAVSEVGKALRTRGFVLWQDLRLAEQRMEWDRKYAKEAVR
ncbi:MAG TPA: hypothetical protein VFV11_05350 [Solimonas sp.]|nr:hypothetical protein [Solimonas sp.]